MNLNIFYDNVKLINTAEEIKYLNEYYKNNYNQYSDFDDFILPIQQLIQNNSLLKYELYKQFLAKRGLQGGILTEINIFKTILTILNITDITIDNNRYIAENNEWSVILQGNLAHGNANKSHDLIIYDKLYNKKYNGEIKEPLARASDGDVRYNEQGQIYKTTRQSIDLECIKDFINYYNTNITVFSHKGHNYQIKPKDCQNLFLNYFNNIDLLFTYVENKLIVIPNDTNLLLKVFSLQGSEIRGCNGKNPVTIFTPIYFKKTIQPFVIEETDTTYTLKYSNNENEIHLVKGRGRIDATRFSIPYGFMFKVADCINQTLDTVTIAKNKIKQLSPNISVHINLLSSYQEIKTLVLERGNII